MNAEQNLTFTLNYHDYISETQLAVRKARIGIDVYISSQDTQYLKVIEGRLIEYKRLQKEFEECAYNAICKHATTTIGFKQNDFARIFDPIGYTHQINCIFSISSFESIFGKNAKKKMLCPTLPRKGRAPGSYSGSIIPYPLLPYFIRILPKYPKSINPFGTICISLMDTLAKYFANNPNLTEVDRDYYEQFKKNFDSVIRLEMLSIPDLMAQSSKIIQMNEYLVSRVNEIELENMEMRHNIFELQEIVDHMRGVKRRKTLAETIAESNDEVSNNNTSDSESSGSHQEEEEEEEGNNENNQR